jgi:hypothetical protein
VLEEKVKKYTKKGQYEKAILFAKEQGLWWEMKKAIKRAYTECDKHFGAINFATGRPKGFSKSQVDDFLQKKSLDVYIT